MASLVPLPGQDGYWLISDLIGKDLRPRLLGVSGWLDIGSGVTLTAVFIPGAMAGLAFLYERLVRGWEVFERNSMASVAHISVAVFVVATTLIFGRSLLLSLFFSVDDKAARSKLTERE